MVQIKEMLKNFIPVLTKRYQENPLPVSPSLAL